MVSNCNSMPVYNSNLCNVRITQRILRLRTSLNLLMVIYFVNASKNDSLSAIESSTTTFGKLKSRISDFNQSFATLLLSKDWKDFCTNSHISLSRLFFCNKSSLICFLSSVSNRQFGITIVFCSSFQ